MDTMINQAYPNAIVGALFQEATTGKILFQHQPDKLLSPASNIKVFLAVAAWFELGEDFQFTTTLSRLDNTLYVSFSGDPSLTHSDLNTLIQSVTFKPDNVVIDNSAYSSPYHPAGITFDDLGWYYEAPCTSVIIDENAVEFYLQSSQALGGPVQIISSDRKSPLQLINNLKTVSWEEAKNDCDMHVDDMGNNRVRLYGCLAQRQAKKRINLAIPDPVLYAKTIIQHALSSQKFNGTIESGITPQNVDIIASHNSKKLADLLKFMLQESDNLYADSLTKRLGIKINGEGSFIQGAAAIKQALRKHTAVNIDQIKIRDGQGTRYNLITPTQMNRLLIKIWQTPRLKALMMDSLPAVGKTGTLADRLKNTKLTGHVKAKTGSMHDTSSLAGFMLSPDGTPVIFSIIINHINGNVYNAKAFEDKLLMVFYQQSQRAEKIKN